MTGPVFKGRNRVGCLSARRLPCVGPRVASDPVSTRGLILAALLCGLAILVAFAIQITMGR